MGGLCLKEIYNNNMASARKYYNSLGFDLIVLVNADETDEYTYNSAKNIIGVDFVSVIAAQGVNFTTVLACEFSSREIAEYAFINFFETGLPGVFVLYENIVFFDTYASYILLDNGFDVFKDGAVSKDLTKIIFCNSNVVELVVPDSIVEITGQSCAVSNLKKVTMGENVVKIGAQAFFQCELLNSVKLNNSLQKIGKMAFYDCKSLQYIVIPKSVSIIDRMAFNTGNIYCEVASKPDGWNNEFTTGAANVYWLGEWEYDKNGIPQPVTKSNDNVTDETTIS